MRVALIGTYELGRQPFGLASAAAWLRESGADVSMLDLSVQRLDERAVAPASLVAFYLPMHTATRIAVVAAERVRKINPSTHLCFFGLYASINEPLLRSFGDVTILGGEFEEGLRSLYQRLVGPQPAGPSNVQPEPVLSLKRQRFLVPDRAGLPPAREYAKLRDSTGKLRTTGYTEASRGCKHLCRHCPIVPVYEGQLRLVQEDAVLADIRQQEAAGSRHISFGDPDFFNAPRHSMAIVERLHEEFPKLTYDVTIKVEHLLKHAHLIPKLRDTGCLFVTSAVESFDDAVLEKFAKGHTCSDFLAAVSLLRDCGVTFNPTFVTFTPWTTLVSYAQMLGLIAQLDLIGNVASVQYTIRLLIPRGSKLLDLPEVRELVGEFDEAALCYPWAHPDPNVDSLHHELVQLLTGSPSETSRREFFGQTWERTRQSLATNGICWSEVLSNHAPATASQAPDESTIPYLTEPWYC